eukprot:gb/GECH01010523.1/.p1 GENE.gb/GECH01010523.1/~~gb/GECH01010523.1/.p1  ORF type:complete len:232 (+),score=62.99 gb/GECH01010523.1/:1-696(+)
MAHDNAAEEEAHDAGEMESLGDDVSGESEEDDEQEFEGLHITEPNMLEEEGGGDGEEGAEGEGGEGEPEEATDGGGDAAGGDMGVTYVLEEYGVEDDGDGVVEDALAEDEVIEEWRRRAGGAVETEHLGEYGEGSDGIDGGDDGAEYEGFDGVVGVHDGEGGVAADEEDGGADADGGDEGAEYGVEEYGAEVLEHALSNANPDSNIIGGRIKYSNMDRLNCICFFMLPPNK